MKFIRKPLATTFALLVIISVIYFMTSSPEDKSLGPSSPVNLQKYSNQEPLKLNDQNNKIIQPLEENQETEEKISIDKAVEKPLFSSEQMDLLPEQDLETTETPFMPKMANETLKAQLGISAWRLFHTILARYPENPTKQEQSTLSQYIKLFAQVYPCGDCARHFQKLLQEFPPQIKSRKNASLWGCDIHNKVNAKLKKPEYDCTTILEDYDCGCGDDEQEKDYTLGNESIQHLRNIKIDEKEENPQLGG